MPEVYIPLHLLYFSQFLCNSFRFLSWFNFVLFPEVGMRGEEVKGWGGEGGGGTESYSRSFSRKD